MLLTHAAILLTLVFVLLASLSCDIVAFFGALTAADGFQKVSFASPPHLFSWSAPHL